MDIREIAIAVCDLALDGISDIIDIDGEGRDWAGLVVKFSSWERFVAPQAYFHTIPQHTKSFKLLTASNFGTHVFENWWKNAKSVHFNHFGKICSLPSFDQISFILLSQNHEILHG